MSIQAILEPPLSSLENRTREEVYLSRATPTARVAVLNDRSVSIGVGQSEATESLVRARSAGLTVIRRNSGGTGVLHLPGDVVFSIVLPRDHPLVGRGYVRAYARLGRGVTEFFRSVKIETEWSPPPNLSSDFCFLGGRGQVLRTGGRILGGAAQHLTSRALLHHGVIPRALDRERISEIFALPPVLVRQHLTSLEETVPPDQNREIASGLLSYLATFLGEADP